MQIIKTRKSIAVNKKASHNYSLEQKFIGGLALKGWEVKSARAGHTNITESYITIKNNEAFLENVDFIPAQTTPKENITSPKKIKLLLKRTELNKLINITKGTGYNLIPTSLFWEGCWLKVEFFTAIGKNNIDKRHDKKEKDWLRQKEITLKRN